MHSLRNPAFRSSTVACRCEACRSSTAACMHWLKVGRRGCSLPALGLQSQITGLIPATVNVYTHVSHEMDSMSAEILSAVSSLALSRSNFSLQHHPLCSQLHQWQGDAQGRLFDREDFVKVMKTRAQIWSEVQLEIEMLLTAVAARPAKAGGGGAGW